MHSLETQKCGDEDFAFLWFTTFSVSPTFLAGLRGLAIEPCMVPRLERDGRNDSLNRKLL